MKPLKIKPKTGPEAQIQQRIVRMLRYKGWFVKETHGGIFQSGFPDIYATHSNYGARWIEVKNPESYSFTAAQQEDFPKFQANGTEIWILVSDSEDEYQKLFYKNQDGEYEGNWYHYLSTMRSHR